MPTKEALRIALSCAQIETFIISIPLLFQLISLIVNFCFSASHIIVSIIRIGFHQLMLLVFQVTEHGSCWSHQAYLENLGIFPCSSPPRAKIRCKWFLFDWPNFFYISCCFILYHKKDNWLFHLLFHSPLLFKASLLTDDHFSKLVYHLLHLVQTSFQKSSSYLIMQLCIRSYQFSTY